MPHTPLSARTAAAPQLLFLLLFAGLLTALGAPTPAVATRLPGCTAAQLRLAHARTEAATGHRFDRFRVTNTGDHSCRLYGYPSFRFRNAGGRPIGSRSTPSGVRARVVRLDPGGHTHLTVGTVDPSLPLARECHARRAASVDVRLPFRPHVYHRPISRDVCTTKKYRPSSYPVGF